MPWLGGPAGELLVGGKHGVRTLEMVLGALLVVHALLDAVVRHRLAALLDLGIGQRHGRKQALGVGMHRVGKDLLGGTRQGL